MFWILENWLGDVVETEKAKCVAQCSEQTIAPLYKGGICGFEFVLEGVCFFVFFVLLRLG